MKRIAIAVVCLFQLSTFTIAADNPKADTNPAHKDKKFLLNYLKQTRQDFLKSISGLSEAQWNYKPSPERWSIAECAEHITLAENFIRDAKGQETDKNWGMKQGARDYLVKPVAAADLLAKISALG